MGKQAFADIYVSVGNAQARRPVIQGSAFCDRYKSTSNYAGMIIYHMNGSHTWQHNVGICRGTPGTSFYVLILSTDSGRGVHS